MATYLGPANQIEMPDGTVIRPGDECDFEPSVKLALEKSGHHFSDTEADFAPQSASENLAEEGKTAEGQAASSGLSVGSQPQAQPTAPPEPAPPTAPKGPSPA